MRTKTEDGWNYQYSGAGGDRAYRQWSRLVMRGDNVYSLYVEDIRFEFFCPGEDGSHGKHGPAILLEVCGNPILTNEDRYLAVYPLGSDIDEMKTLAIALARMKGFRCVDDKELALIEARLSGVPIEYINWMRKTAMCRSAAEVRERTHLYLTDPKKRANVQKWAAMEHIQEQFGRGK